MNGMKNLGLKRPPSLMKTLPTMKESENPVLHVEQDKLMNSREDSLNTITEDVFNDIEETVKVTDNHNDEVKDKTSLLPPYIYGGSIRLLNWGNTARTGMTVELGIRDISHEDIHPFKGMLCGKEHGQRLKVWIGPGLDHLLINQNSDGAFYKGDGLLLRWSDDSVNGMSIKILIDCSIDGVDGKHPLDGFETGRKTGEIMTFLAWAVSDDENIQDPAFVRKKKPFAELSPVSQAQILSGDSRFISFLARNEHTLLSEPVPIRPVDNPKLYASDFIRLYIGVSSRAEMNYETPEAAIARKKWRDLLSYYDRSRGKS